MKIQFNGGQSFSLEGKEVKCLFDPETEEQADFAMFSQKKAKMVKGVKKNLLLPGEFEISGALIQGFYTDSAKNIVFKVMLEDVTFAHFGEMKDVPGSKFFEDLGESIDVIFMNLSTDFDEKKAKDLLGKIEPRMAILGGDVAYFPKMVELAGAKTSEENPMKLVRSGLSDDKTEVVILTA